jgi:hypothetical protein
MWLKPEIIGAPPEQADLSRKAPPVGGVPV